MKGIQACEIIKESGRKRIEIVIIESNKNEGVCEMRRRHGGL